MFRKKTLGALFLTPIAAPAPEHQTPAPVRRVSSTGSGGVGWTNGGRFRLGEAKHASTVPAHTTPAHPASSGATAAATETQASAADPGVDNSAGGVKHARLESGDSEHQLGHCLKKVKRRVNKRIVYGKKLHRAVAVGRGPGKKPMFVRQSTCPTGRRVGSTYRSAAAATGSASSRAKRRGGAAASGDPGEAGPLGAETGGTAGGAAQPVAPGGRLRILDDDNDEDEQVTLGPASGGRGIESLRSLERVTIADGLRVIFGKTEFLPGQAEVITRILQGQSTLFIAPTGAGKSLCYQLPAALLDRGLLVVVSPLLALMEDQLTNLPGGVCGVALSSIQSAVASQEAMQQLQSGQARVLFLSPEKIASRHFVESIAPLLPPIAVACVDEAHCISEWSHNFRPSYLALRHVFHDVLHVPCILALTATATARTAAHIVAALGIDRPGLPPEEKAAFSRTRSSLPLALDPIQVRFQPDPTSVITSRCTLFTLPPDLLLRPLRSAYVAPDPIVRLGDVTRANIALAVSRDRSETALLALIRSPEWLSIRPLLIYTFQQFQADELADFLRAQSLDAQSYHAGKPPRERVRIQTLFTTGRLDILCATPGSFGMGLDMTSLRGVVHFCMPRSLEHYVQEIGRAGRDGKPARSHVFLHDADYIRIRSLTCSESVDATSVGSLLTGLFKGDAAVRPVPTEDTSDATWDSRPLHSAQSSGSFLLPTRPATHQLAVEHDIRPPLIEAVLAYLAGGSGGGALPECPLDPVLAGGSWVQRVPAGTEKMMTSNSRRLHIATGIPTQGEAIFLRTAPFHLAENHPVVKALLRVGRPLRRPKPTYAFSCMQVRCPITMWTGAFLVYRSVTKKQHQSQGSRRCGIEYSLMTPSSRSSASMDSLDCAFLARHSHKPPGREWAPFRALFALLISGQLSALEVRLAVPTPRDSLISSSPSFHSFPHSPHHSPPAIQQAGEVRAYLRDYCPAIRVLRRPTAGDISHLAEALAARLSTIHRAAVSKLDLVYGTLAGSASTQWTECHPEEVSARVRPLVRQYFAGDPLPEFPGPIQKTPRKVRGLEADIRALWASVQVRLEDGTRPTPRLMARVLHGVASPGQTAAQWNKTPFWKQYAHVDFEAVRHLLAVAVLVFGGADGGWRSPCWDAEGKIPMTPPLSTHRPATCSWWP
ncbi:putative ATP-dependent DNA helicase [Paratrimastix pyriformis]|uniref:DNA 3'-5' helicase n=1 Tax=Paratrimastix pyriformis TaxID=342808 RepID=A0ABQ8UCN5_9EUKA|nr:putative ATP-dependent DNA helicase [Paratrimastix pyriformis]